MMIIGRKPVTALSATRPAIRAAQSSIGPRLARVACTLVATAAKTPTRVSSSMGAATTTLAKVRPAKTAPTTEPVSSMTRPASVPKAKAASSAGVSWRVKVDRPYTT